MCWTACHSKLAAFTRQPGRSCVHSNTSLMVRLATQFTINFLYLDVWPRRHILPPFWVDFPSLLSLLESSITYFSPASGLFGARVLAFSLEKAPIPFLKTPPFALIYCCSVWENVRLKRASESNLSCAAGMRVCVSGAVCMCSFSLHDQLLLACLTRYPVITSTPPLYFTSRAHTQPTHTHSLRAHAPRSGSHIRTFPHLIKPQKRRKRQK